MRFAFRFLVLASCIAAVAARGEVVVDFQDLTVPGSGYFNGNPGTLTPGASVSTPWSSGSVSFANTFGIDGDFYYEYWSGFAYSNVVNTTNPAFTNQYASYPGGGYQSSTYAVAYDEATVTLPVPTRVAGFRIANTTYAALTMLNGDQYGISKPLASGTGWFATTATGKLAGATIGTATFYLADLRGETPLGIRDTWAWFDLDALGTVDQIQFTFDGSDKNAQGLLTPAYFAMDDLTISAVPEPATVTLLAVAGLVGGTAAAGRWRRRRHVG
jgi:hypothetical protein